jgi:hypothetical protein
MGKIYSRAREVLSWLGDSSGTAAYLDRIEQGYINGGARTRWDFDIPGTVEYYQGLELIQSDYWKRAWITQEVSLARQVTLCAGLAEMTFEVFPYTFFNDMPPNRMLEDWAMGERSGLQGRSLIYLIHRFKSKESNERRDCIYSLLALCGEGFDLQVDYNSSETTITRKVLECCKQSFCLCAIKVVAYTLDVKYGHFWSSRTQLLDLGSEPFAYITLPVIRSDPPSWSHWYQLSKAPYSEPDRCGQHSGLAWIQFSREEEMAVFIGPQGDTVVIIFPEKICPKSAIALFEIKMSEGVFHSSLIMCDVHGRQRTKHLVNGISLRLDPRPLHEVCQIFFSFDFMLAFDGLSFDSPCDRVKLQGTADVSRLRDPSLRLCS